MIKFDKTHYHIIKFRTICTRIRAHVPYHTTPRDTIQKVIIRCDIAFIVSSIRLLLNYDKQIKRSEIILLKSKLLLHNFTYSNWRANNNK